MVDVAHGGMWDHHSSSSLEVTWNILRANGVSEEAFAKLDLADCPECYLKDDFIHPKVLRRRALRKAYYQRIISEIPQPMFLSEIRKLNILSPRRDSKICEECAESGVHSVMFELPWVHECPIHSTSLYLNNADYNLRKVASNRVKRRRLVQEFNKLSLDAIATLKEMKNNYKPFHPMNQRQTGVRKFYFDFFNKITNNCMTYASAYSAVTHGSKSKIYCVSDTRRRSSEASEALIRKAYEAACKKIDAEVLFEQKALKKRRRDLASLYERESLKIGLYEFLDRDRETISAFWAGSMRELGLYRKKGSRARLYFWTSLDQRVSEDVCACYISRSAIEHVVNLKVYETLYIFLLRCQIHRHYTMPCDARDLEFAYDSDSVAFHGFYFGDTRNMLLPVHTTQSVIYLANSVIPLHFRTAHERKLAESVT
ncbi:hypothetical protein [Wenzhouxiangella limi]|uniref:TniQ protein n=1 Tax=Wenzhouxiangella limi TaxID=2707351 RepID=A0A845UVY6_9GAMM|nr:hypothetical protein [Wenzhouxiangella limi]NDY94758.1 hypothetical protein [Wenzhouxiangella limi]